MAFVEFRELMEAPAFIQALATSPLIQFLAATPVADAIGLSPLALTAGCGCLVVQISLWLIFSFVLPAGPWTKLPGFTAHQVICFPLMIYLAVVGVQAWLFPAPSMIQYSATMRDRVLKSHPIGGCLSHIVFGELVMWDIPCGLFVSNLREALMLAHHFGMAIVAYACLGPLCSYYAVFFFGTIEVSGIPLSLVDVFHPKHVHWFEYEKSAPRLAAVNEVARVCFAAAYLPLRACYFPWVVVTQAIPDMLAALELPREERPNAPDAALYGVIVFGLAFSALQIYWGTLVFKQVLKALGVGTKPKAKAN